LFDVLLVEDNDMIGDAVAEQITADGNRVVWVKNVAAALEAIGDRPFDVVVLDLRLPDGHGFSVLDHIRARQIFTPVLVLTAFDQVTDQLAGLERGASDFLVKPFSLRDLTHRMAILANPHHEAHR
jgi:two-component system, OmpR family, response regulator